MKNLTLIFLLAISCSTFAQTIRRCNNNPGISGVNVYTTIQAAHDAAADGDIIYVDPSVNTYGSLDCRKRITIIGNGYFLGQNTNNSSDTRTSIVGDISFNVGSANSVLTGIRMQNQIAINDVNVTLTRCYLGGVGFGFSSASGLSSRGNNAIITKCIVTSISGNNSLSVSQQYGYNTLVSNCIIQSTISTLTNSVINNNILNKAGGGNFITLNGCSVTNNIVDARGMSTVQEFVNGVNNGTSIGNTISNNICLGQAGTPSGNGNVNFGDPTITFLIANPWSSGTEDAPFQLALGSPAIGIGTGGTNAGAFGGASPYILSGLPAYPVMTNFTTSGVGNTSTPLQVSVTVRGNN